MGSNLFHHYHITLITFGDSCLGYLTVQNCHREERVYTNAFKLSQYLNVSLSVK